LQDQEKGSWKEWYPIRCYSRRSYYPFPPPRHQEEWHSQGKFLKKMKTLNLTFFFRSTLKTVKSMVLSSSTTVLQFLLLVVTTLVVLVFFNTSSTTQVLTKSLTLRTPKVTHSPHVSATFSWLVMVRNHSSLFPRQRVSALVWLRNVINVTTKLQHQPKLTMKMMNEIISFQLN